MFLRAYLTRFGIQRPCRRPGPKAHLFPQVVLRSHDRRRFWFYEDLLAQKVVMINFMSVANHDAYPVTDNLRRVQELLGDRVGRDVHMYSITSAPRNDTPEVLNEFATSQGVGPGWLFLTGDPDDIELLKRSLYMDLGHRHDPGHHRGESKDCSMGLVRYGNEKIGLWGSVPATADPRWIVRRLDWIQPGEEPDGTPRRKGPLPLKKGPE